MAYEPEQPHDPESESWSSPFEHLLPEAVSMSDDPLGDADSEPSGPSFGASGYSSGDTESDREWAQWYQEQADYHQSWADWHAEQAA